MDKVASKKRDSESEDSDKILADLEKEYESEHLTGKNIQSP